ncbi:MAG: PAS domain S-box protein [Candidatus Helarchaeota archaeon]
MGFEKGSIKDVIKNSEKFYKKLFEGSPSNIILADENGIILDCNKNVENIAKSPRNEIIGKNFLEFFVDQPETIEFLKKKLVAFIETGGTLAKFEFSSLDKQNNVIWLRVEPTLIKFEDETYIQVVFHDITETKLSQLKIKESEKKYRQTLDLLPDIVYELDKNLNLTYLNKTGIEKFGYNYEDYKKGLNLNEMVSPKDLDRALNNMRKFVEGGEISSTDYILRRKDGTEFWGRVRSQVIKKNDEVIGVEGIITDITRQKQLQAVLKESEEKFRTITEQSLMGIAIIQDNRVKYVNKKFADVLGYTVEEIMKLPQGTHRTLIHPDDLDFVVAQVRKKQQGNTDVVSHYTYRLLKKNGETVWVENLSKTINFGGKLADLVMIIDITDRQRSNQELKESEEKFREISEQSLMGICILQDNKIKYANQKFADIIGYSIEEMMNWEPSEYIKTVHPDDRKRTIEQAIRKQHGNKNVITHYETRGMTKTGKIRWFDNYSKSIRYGGKYADLVMITDITEKKVAEQKLKESEEKYRLISENANDMIGILNQRFEYEYINEKTVMETVGYSNKDIIGKSPIEFIHPDDLELAVHTFKTGFESSEGGCVLRFRTKEEKYIWLEVKGRVFRDVNGEKKWLIFSRDISEKKALEESRRNYTRDLEIEVKRKTKDLREEKKLVDSIINTISDGVLVLDSKGKLLLINNTLKDYYTQIYNVDFPIDFSSFSKPNNIFDETVRQLFISNKPNNVTIEPKEGKFLQLVSIGNFDFENSVLGSIIEVRDVTPFVEFDTMRRHFVSTVTHEIRTPISALMQSIENLEDYKHKLSQELQDKLLETISQNVKLLSELVEDLLFLSKIEERKINLQWNKYYPSKIVKEILGQIEPHRIRKNIKFDLEIDETIYLFGDIRRIGQIFRIFIDNALKYSNEQTSVKIRAIDNYRGKFNPKNEEGMLLQFCDSGLGIQQKDLPHLFKRFFRSEEVRNMPGTGLGLAIAKELILLHYGEVFVESKFGKGSVFSIFLPRLENRPSVNYK